MVNMKKLKNSPTAWIMGAVAIVAITSLWVYSYESRPSALPPSQLKVVPIQQWTTSEGLKSYFVSRPELPMLDIVLTFDAGSARDDSQYGMAALTNALLTGGTKHLSEHELAIAIDNIGAQLSTDVSKDQASIHLRTLSSEKERNFAINILKQILKNASFEQSKIERTKKQLMVSLQAQNQQPSTIAKNTFYHHLYKNHPYGHATDGTAKTLAKIQRDEVVAFFHKQYSNANAVLSIVGDVNSQDAQTIADTLSKAMPKGHALTALANPKPLAKNENVHIEFPAKQTHIWQGTLGIARDDKQFFPLLVSNEMFGGIAFVSKLFHAVRVDSGLAYHAQSVLMPLQTKGPFLMLAQTRNDKASQTLGLFQSVLHDYQQNGINTDDLWTAKQHLTGGFPLKFASNAKIVNLLAYIGYYQLPVNYFDEFNKNVNAVTAQQAKAQFNQLTQKNPWLTVTVGHSGS